MSADTRLSQLQPGEAGQPADPAAEREARHAGVTDDAAGDREAVGLRGAVEVGPRRPAAAAGAARGRIDDDVAHRAEVDHQGVVGDRRPGEVVSAPAHGESDALPARQRDRVGHLVRRATAHDQRGPAIDVAVPDAARLVVAGVVRYHDLAAELLAERPHALGHRRHSPAPSRGLRDATRPRKATATRRPGA
jgi:hypothetical protein